MFKFYFGSLLCLERHIELHTHEKSGRLSFLENDIAADNYLYGIDCLVICRQIN